MITSKTRAKLRSLSNGTETLFQVGKTGISENLIAAANDAITARELIKLSVLETADTDTAEIAREIAEKIRAEVISVVGRKFVLYRENPKDKKIFID